MFWFFKTERFVYELKDANRTYNFQAIEVFEIEGFMLFMMLPAVKTTSAFKYDLIARCFRLLTFSHFIFLAWKR